MNPLNVVELALKLALVIVEGQPPEVRAELARMWLKDVKFWRKALGIDSDEPANG